MKKLNLKGDDLKGYRAAIKATKELNKRGLNVKRGGAMADTIKRVRPIVRALPDADLRTLHNAVMSGTQPTFVLFQEMALVHVLVAEGRV